MFKPQEAPQPGRITVQSDGDGIVALSKSGKKLFLLPKESLDLGFDKGEQ